MITLKEPPYKITNEIISLVSEISELIGRATVSSQLDKNPTLRRRNRIHTIYSSLAIEQNTLSLEQVTDVINGKRIIAPPKDIEEVKNAYEIYELLDTLDPYSMDDLLKAHGVMMRGLTAESGEFRSGGSRRGRCKDECCCTPRNASSICAAECGKPAFVGS